MKKVIEGFAKYSITVDDKLEFFSVEDRLTDTSQDLWLFPKEIQDVIRDNDNAKVRLTIEIEVI